MDFSRHFSFVIINKKILIHLCFIPISNRLARNLFFKMCKYNVPLRYETYNALKHPWVTRSTNSQIPETLIESYSKFDMIYKFKALLGMGMAFFVFKACHQDLFSKIKEKEKDEVKETDGNAQNLGEAIPKK